MKTELIFFSNASVVHKKFKTTARNGRKSEKKEEEKKETKTQKTYITNKRNTTDEKRRWKSDERK